MSNLIPFIFEHAIIRVVAINGEAWFVGKDVAKTLEYTNPQKAIRDHCPHARPVGQGVNENATPLDPQTVVIKEADVLRLIIRSKLPGAERFERLVFDEILPTIIRTGSYGRSDPMAMLNDPVQLRGLLASYSDKVVALEQQVAVQSPKVEVYDLIMNSDHTICLRDTATLLNTKQSALIRFMNLHGWIYSRAGRWIGFSKRIEKDQLVHKIGVATHGNDKEHAYQQVLVTMKGVEALANHMKIQLPDGWRSRFA